jgi:hypothetical protein
MSLKPTVPYHSPAPAPQGGVGVHLPASRRESPAPAPQGGVGGHLLASRHELPAPAPQGKVGDHLPATPTSGGGIGGPFSYPSAFRENEKSEMNDRPPPNYAGMTSGGTIARKANTGMGGGMVRRWRECERPSYRHKRRRTRSGGRGRRGGGGCSRFAREGGW